MATLCNRITENQLKGCNTLLVDGNETTLYLANRDDISAYVRDVDNPNIIRDIIMKSTKKFFKYEGTRTTLKPLFTSVKKNFGTKYKHSLDAVIFNWNSAVKSEIEQLLTGTFVAIIVNKDKTGDASIEVYGTDIGMIAKDGAVRDLNSADFGSNFPFGLESEEGQEEPHTPASFAVLDELDAYSYTDSFAALEALLVPAV